jgi:mRNA interferase HicA
LKREELIRRLKAAGCTLVRHGGRHDWYTNPSRNASQPVPRHSEVNEYLARSILKKLTGKDRYPPPHPLH